MKMNVYQEHFLKTNYKVDFFKLLNSTYKLDGTNDYLAID